MILVQDTPNHAGVAICGDQADFSQLYEALNELHSKDETYPPEETWIVRSLALNYDLRHATMDDRDMQLVDSGMRIDGNSEPAGSDRHSVTRYNYYHKIYVFWPEVLYDVLAINELIAIYTRKINKHADAVLSLARPIWDQNIALARAFQAAVLKEAGSLMTPGTFTRMQKNLFLSVPLLHDLYDQYIDRLNATHLRLPAKKRLRNIPAIARQLMNPGESYQLIKQNVDQFAQEHHTYPDNVRFSNEYPPDIDW